MALILSDDLRRELIGHARSGAPDEVCGVLAGRVQGRPGGPPLERVERVFPVRNTADEVAVDSGVFRDRDSGTPVRGQAPRHYYLDPRDQLRVYNEIDALGLDLVAYYHSHTHTEARPSPTDVRLATDTTTAYVLVSLQESDGPAVRAWRILKEDPMDETGEVVEVPIQPWHA